MLYLIRYLQDEQACWGLLEDQRVRPLNLPHHQPDKTADQEKGDQKRQNGAKPVLKAASLLDLNTGPPNFLRR